MDKEKLELLREHLYNIMDFDQKDYDDILETSRELDKYIAEYMRSMEDKKKNN